MNRVHCDSVCYVKLCLPPGRTRSVVCGDERGATDSHVVVEVGRLQEIVLEKTSFLLCPSLDGVLIFDA